jgi:hypothetical protein
MQTPVSAEATRAPQQRPRDLAEPLEANAATAWRLARDVCAAAGAEPGCAWYHGVYPTLRLLGLAATPERHARFYADALDRCALAGFERALVSGAADTAMLAQLLAAYAARTGARPRVQVLDRCATPLRLCRDYAARLDAELETRQLDLCDPRALEPPARPFDLICTHSLLTMQSPEQRPDVIAAWRAQLRPGGKVASCVRIEAEATRPRESGAFRERVLARASAWRGRLPADPAEIAERAQVFAERAPSWPVASQDELAQLLLEGGFAIEQLDVVDVAGSLPAPDASPGSARPATYAEFVALRV